jgi:hypothetical protein
MRKLVASCTILLASASLPSAAASPWLVDVGRGNAIQFIGVGRTLFDRRDVLRDGAWQLDRLWVGRVSFWNAEHPEPSGKHLADLSLMPTLRLSERAHDGMQPFVEAGIGAHLLSQTSIDNRRMSTAFQFGEQLAVGVRFEGAVPFSISFRGEHVSNGGIKEPNAGVTFAAFRVQLEWR